MPNKKEQTAEKSPKAKAATKKQPTKVAAATLDLPSSTTARQSKAPAKKPVKKAPKETPVEEPTAGTSSHPPTLHDKHPPGVHPSPESEPRLDELPVTEENISVRAYFIGEHRRAYGIPGSSEEDWHEAERQLRAEAVAFSESLRGNQEGLQGH